MRGKQIKKKLLEPDSKYGSLTVARLINYVMKDGKKSIAQKIVYSCLDDLSKELEKDPLIIIEQSIKNVGPLMEVRSHRVGGGTYQVPVEVSKNRRLVLAIRWILNVAREKKGSDMASRLKNELLNAYNNEGSAVKKKNDTHKMAEANKAFAHFAKY